MSTIRDVKQFGSLEKGDKVAITFEDGEQREYKITDIHYDIEHSAQVVFTPLSILPREKR